MSDIILFLVFAAVVILVWVAARETRLQRNGNSLVRLLERDHPLYCTYSSGLKSRIVTINGINTRWTPFVISVMRDEIALYRVAPGELEHSLSIETPHLRWFGRPEKYTSGVNEIWLHAEVNGEWALVQLRLYRSQMQTLVRALKEIATPEQVTAYRRHRPYIHSGPVSARAAMQTILGAWKLEQPVDLYLMPAFLVMLEGTRVQRLFPLHTIQQIAAVERLDRPRAAGLVRFEYEGENFAFALEHYAEFAEALAEAAKRTLEDPLQWQRKKKKSDDFDDYDSDQDDDFDQDDDQYGYYDVGIADRLDSTTGVSFESLLYPDGDLSAKDRADDDETQWSSRITR